MTAQFATVEDAIRAMPGIATGDLENLLFGESHNLQLKCGAFAELLRRQKQRHLDLCAAYRDEMEAISGTLNGGPYHEGSSLAARHIYNLIQGVE